MRWIRNFARTKKGKPMEIKLADELLDAFKEMTLLDNVVLGCHRHLDYSGAALLLALPGFRQAERQARARALELLGWMRLDHKADMLADNLSYGEQRKLEIWLQIELLASEALVKEKIVPAGDFARIKAGCDQWLADLPGLRQAVLTGDSDTAVAGLEALSAAAGRVSEAARWVACVTRLFEAEALGRSDDGVKDGVTLQGHDPGPLA